MFDSGIIMFSLLKQKLLTNKFAFKRKADKKPFILPEFEDYFLYSPEIQICLFCSSNAKSCSPATQNLYYEDACIFKAVSIYLEAKISSLQLHLK